eukprot:16412-Chlamydomonas_euryale.AAC.2
MHMAAAAATLSTAQRMPGHASLPLACHVETSRTYRLARRKLHGARFDISVARDVHAVEPQVGLLQEHAAPGATLFGQGRRGKGRGGRGGKMRQANRSGRDVGAAFDLHACRLGMCAVTI